MIKYIFSTYIPDMKFEMREVLFWQFSNLDCWWAGRSCALPPLAEYIQKLFLSESGFQSNICLFHFILVTLFFRFFVALATWFSLQCFSFARPFFGHWVKRKTKNEMKSTIVAEIYFSKYISVLYSITLYSGINCWSSEMSLIMRDLSNKTMLWPKLPSIFVVKTVVCLYFSTYVLCRGILVISLWVNSKVGLLINSRYEATCISYFVNFYRASVRRKVKVFRMLWKSWEQQKM
jgi:hypothetical protein